jgi:hypothetical protein
MPSKWMEWKPTSDTSETQYIGGNPIINGSEPCVIEKTHIPSVSKVSEADTWTPFVMPKGVRLVSWNPKFAPVAIETCSIVVDVPKFIKAELLALDSRLNNPSTIHGGFTVPQMLDRLAQAGLEVELEPKGGAQ